MKSENQDNPLFKLNKPMIAMVHLDALPGSAYNNSPLTEISDRALKEADLLAEAGFDAIIVQNTGDVPAAHEGEEMSIAALAVIGDKIRQRTGLTLGVNVLMNGSRAALAVAKMIQASFVRIKIAVGAVVTSTGVVTADPHAVLNFRRSIQAEDVTLLADVYDRTSAPLADMPIEVMANLAVRHAGASGLVVSGYSVEDTINRMKTLRSALPDTRLYVGGGAKPGNLELFFRLADGIIIGSAYKTGGHFLDPVDPQKAQAVMQAARQARQVIGE